MDFIVGLPKTSKGYCSPKNGPAKFGVLFMGYCATRFSTILETQDSPDQLKYQGQGRVVTFG